MTPGLNKRCLSHKYENRKKGESAQKNIQKQKLKVQKLYHRLELKLSDRSYDCVCGYVEDRDFNASLNLRDAKTYEVA